MAEYRSSSDKKLSLKARLRRLIRSEQLILSSLALLIGVAAAYGSIGFRELIALVQGLGLATHGDFLVAAVAHLPWWQIVLVPVLGGLAVGLLVRFFKPARGRMALPM